jgi:hypothetical protein
LRRTLSWCTRIVPVADDATALAPAVKILERGDKLIWFPEGARSLDGKLHTFKPGIGGMPHAAKICHANNCECDSRCSHQFERRGLFRYDRSTS